MQIAEIIAAAIDRMIANTGPLTNSEIEAIVAHFKIAQADRQDDEYGSWIEYRFEDTSGVTFYFQHGE